MPEECQVLFPEGWQLHEGRAVVLCALSAPQGMGVYLEYNRGSLSVCSLLSWKTRHGVVGNWDTGMLLVELSVLIMSKGPVSVTWGPMEVPGDHKAPSRLPPQAYVSLCPHQCV